MNKLLIRRRMAAIEAAYARIQEIRWAKACQRAAEEKRQQRQALLAAVEKQALLFVIEREEQIAKCRERFYFDVCHPYTFWSEETTIKITFDAWCVERLRHYWARFFPASPFPADQLDPAKMAPHLRLEHERWVADQKEEWRTGPSLDHLATLKGRRAAYHRRKAARAEAAEKAGHR